MARAKSNFIQGDIVRAIKALSAAHQKVTRVEIAKDGRIVIVTGEGGGAEVSNEWDRDLA